MENLKMILSNNVDFIIALSFIAITSTYILSHIYILFGDDISYFFRKLIIKIKRYLKKLHKKRFIKKLSNDKDFLYIMKIK